MFQSKHDNEDDIGIASTRSMLWEAGQQIPGAKSNVADASTLSVERDDGWHHFWVSDVSDHGFFGYKYALLHERTDEIHGWLGREPAQLLTTRDGRFSPGDVSHAITDVLSQ